jgi:OmpA-OmpF porin, OOP family
MKNTARIMLLRAGSIVAGSIIALASTALLAGAPAESTAGYVVGGSGPIVKGSTGICWHNGYWTPSMAILACDPDLAPKPAPPAPPPPAPQAEAPKPAPPPPAPGVKTLKLTATDLFEFNKAVVSPQAKELIDREILAKLSGFKEIKIVIVSGHTDRLGSQQYNQKLSEKRAEAVKSYLVSKGVAASKIEATGFGKTTPVKFGCDDKLKRKQLIECLAPNRRVVIEVSGIAN